MAAAAKKQDLPPPVPESSQPAATIMVLTTPEADAIARKNGLSLVEMLRPFAAVQEANLVVQTVGDPAGACPPGPASGWTEILTTATQSAPAMQANVEAWEHES